MLPLLSDIALNYVLLIHTFVLSRIISHALNKVHAA